MHLTADDRLLFKVCILDSCRICSPERREKCNYIAREGIGKTIGNFINKGKDFIMNYLHKFSFFDPLNSPNKKELFISAQAVDFITWFKHSDQKSEGTMLHTNLGGKTEINHIIEGLPEMVNKMTFEGEFLKCTAQYVGNAGSMKKYTAWVNTENIVSIYQEQPDTIAAFFQSGQKMLIANKVQDFMKLLIDHNKKCKERRKEKYAAKT